MNRSDFLKAIGLAGAGTLLPFRRAAAVPAGSAPAALPAGVDCVIIPQETAGPYPLNLSGDSTKFRQNITEGRPGLPLRVIVTVVNVNANCAPIPNARVDIWQTDKDGVYSGFEQPGANTVGETFMRGIQMTDANGRVEFLTIYPGWYPGRITHIHFQVFVNSVLSATSQMAFPDELNDTVYDTPLYAGRGRNTTVAGNSADSVFRSGADDLQHQIASVTPNAAISGYDASLTVGINGPTAGLIDMEPETGGQFTLDQNYPNPFRRGTTIGFSLIRPSRVEVKIFDVAGKPVTTLLDAARSAGRQSIRWDGTVAGAPVASGNYLFQLTVDNDLGRFSQCKVMTVEEN